MKSAESGEWHVLSEATKVLDEIEPGYTMIVPPEFYKKMRNKSGVPWEYAGVKIRTNDREEKE